MRMPRSALRGPWSAAQEENELTSQIVQTQHLGICVGPQGPRLEIQSVQVEPARRVNRMLHPGGQPQSLQERMNDVHRISLHDGGRLADQRELIPLVRVPGNAPTLRVALHERSQRLDGAHSTPGSYCITQAMLSSVS